MTVAREGYLKHAQLHIGKGTWEDDDGDIRMPMHSTETPL